MQLCDLSLMLANSKVPVLARRKCRLARLYQETSACLCLNKCIHTYTTIYIHQGEKHQTSVDDHLRMLRPTNLVTPAKEARHHRLLQYSTVVNWDH